MSSIRVSWKVFPNKKGLVSGIVLSGFGLSSVIFTLIAQAIINPENENPSVIDGNDKFYSEEISEKVPRFFICVMIVFAVILLISIVLVQIDGM